ncbi:hypothetical protein DFH11DRAFT_1233030 [Phellopilus nigrolimitatus]|nr:hypothetical protein DFH11DRAFT_1233030 [Phellopilus nigrolimitatus]
MNYEVILPPASGVRYDLRQERPPVDTQLDSSSTAGHALTASAVCRAAKTTPPVPRARLPVRNHRARTRRTASQSLSRFCSPSVSFRILMTSLHFSRCRPDVYRPNPPSQTPPVRLPSRRAPHSPASSPPAAAAATPLLSTERAISASIPPGPLMSGQNALCPGGRSAMPSVLLLVDHRHATGSHPGLPDAAASGPLTCSSRPSPETGTETDEGVYVKT